MAPEIKVQAIIEQQKCNTKVQRVEVDGIHSEVMYAPLSSTGETTLIKWLCQVKVKKDNNDEKRNLFCAIGETAKTLEMGKFAFQCLEDDMPETQEFMDTTLVHRYQSMPDYLIHKDAFAGITKPKRKDYRADTRSYEAKLRVKLSTKEMEEILATPRQPRPEKKCKPWIVSGAETEVYPAWLLYTSPSLRDGTRPRMPSSAGK